MQSPVCKQMQSKCN